jgi:hypothetical protein
MFLTTSKDRCILVEFNGIHLAHVARKPTYGRTSGDIPEEDRAVTAARTELGIIMRSR